MIKQRLILASGSPRRRQLLEKAGYSFEVIVPDPRVEESVNGLLPPVQLVMESSCRKAQSVAISIDDGLVLGADTVAVCDNLVLGKPRDRDDARRMLQRLSGTYHRVLTGVTLWHRPSDSHETHLQSTELTMDRLRDDELTAYLDSGQWAGKAGAFGYQDGLDWVQIVSGSESNVVGLPVEPLENWIANLLNRIARPSDQG